MHIDEIRKMKVVASVSGGKDSAALSLWLHENGIEHERIFMDTGWETQSTYDYIDNVLEPKLGKITKLYYDVQLTDEVRQIAETIENKHLGGRKSSMIRLCLKKGMFPSRMMRWCTDYLKVNPAFEYFSENGTQVNAVGVRAEESVARSKLAEFEESPLKGKKGQTFMVWRPLIRWSFDDVVAIHKRHGVVPNPEYIDGAERVGCFPCIFSRKSEIRRVAERHPARIDLLRDLESAVSERARIRKEAKGEIVENPPSWFQAPNAGTRIEDGREVRNGTCWPIDKVVSWSKTSRGGQQHEMFTLPPSEAGCLRWGFCENHYKEE